jgi:hypothetical protein
LILCNYAHPETDECWPSVGTLARRCDLTRETTRIALRRLEAEGLIGAEDRFDQTGRQTSRLYRILRREGEVPAAPGGPRDAGETPPRETGRTTSPPDGEVTTLKDSKKEKGKDTLAAEPGGFEIFWSLYPKKVGKDGARKAWMKLAKNLPSLTDLTRILTLQAGSPDWKKEDGRFIPHPATWLNGRRWEDELETGPQFEDEDGSAAWNPDDAAAAS